MFKYEVNYFGVNLTIKSATPINQTMNDATTQDMLGAIDSLCNVLASDNLTLRALTLVVE